LHCVISIIRRESLTRRRPLPADEQHASTNCCPGATISAISTAM